MPRKVVAFDFDMTITCVPSIPLFKITEEIHFNLDEYLAEPFKSRNIKQTINKLNANRDYDEDVFIVASFSMSNYVIPILKKIKLYDFFDYIVTPDVLGFKSSADIFMDRKRIGYKNAMIERFIPNEMHKRDVLLIDDNAANCRSAMEAGYSILYLCNRCMDKQDISTISEFLKNHSTHYGVAVSKEEFPCEECNSQENHQFQKPYCALM